MMDTPKHPANILIVDDHPLVRIGLRHLVEAAPDLAVCAETGTMHEALALARQHQPDLMVIDLSLANGSGLKLIKRLRTLSPRVKVLVASMHDEHLFAERALHAGALGYIHKREMADKIVEAIHHVLKGKIYLSATMIDQMLLNEVNGANPAPEESSITKLSDRELEVFELIGRGLGTVQIADQLHLSVKTIETHRAHIKKKLNLDSSNQLVRKAFQWMMGI